MNFKEKLSQIKAFVFDCDGVLTDGNFWVFENGDMIRSFNAKDGYAMVRALSKGYPVAIITGGVGGSLTTRFTKLGIKDVYLGSQNKLADLDDFRAKYDLKREEILFVGDDLPDMEPMQRVGLAVCPADAALEIKEISHFVSEYPGGKGCVRDIIQQVLRVRGDWCGSSPNIQ